MRRIISGGQRGADRGGLFAAQRLKIPTGGTAPKGWLTEDGPDSTLGSVFGLTQHESESYRPRTRANVADSDGTVIFTRARSLSGGSLLTKRYCLRLHRPWLWNPGDVITFRHWLAQFKIQTLNVAGSRESHAPGIEQYVARFLVEALSVKGVDV